MIYLGIDVGLQGAFAWVTRDGNLIEIADMPTIEIRGKRRVCAALVADKLATRNVDLVVIEGVGSRPGEGAAGAFAFGYGAGLIEGVATGMELPVRIVQASQWKRKAGVPADKGATRAMAASLWPGAADQFKRVKDDGRADSALLARWAAMGGV